jgi:uncharacterized membrane protein
VANTGNVELRNVRWELPEEARWDLALVSDYPIPLLRPGEHARFPLLIGMGVAAAANITLQAEDDQGEPYERSQLVSIFG